MITQFLINGLIKGLLYAVSAFGFAVVFNTTKIFHIAFVAIHILAAYIFYSISALLGLPSLLSGLLSIIAVGYISVILDKGIYQKFEEKGATHNILLIASLAIMIITINSIALFYGNDTKVISNTILKSIEFENHIITRNQIYQLVSSLVVIISLAILFTKTNIGLQLRGLRDNPMLMSVLGYNSKHLRVAVFFLSGVLIAIPAMLYSYDTGIDPYVGMPILLNAVVAMIIGGVGSYTSPIVGGIILGLIQSISVYFFDAKWETSITFSILILFLIFLPNGIFGETKRAV